MTSVDVIHLGTPSTGWSPNGRLALLAADLLGGRAYSLVPPRGGMLQKLSAPMYRAKGPSDRGVLVIARTPYELCADALPKGVLRQYGFAVIWVIDAFRHEDIPPRWRIGPYDAIAVCRPNDEAIYRKTTGKPVLVLPWGTDALGLGSTATERSVDVQRLGRQPPAWEDDTVSAEACAAHGLRFAGRPPMLDDPLETHAALMRGMSAVKYVIAFSNLVAPAPYTHPTQDYVTARWTDALAAGAVVAGIPPRQDASVAAFWPEALLEFDQIDLTANVAMLAKACAGWTDTIALRNHREALERLDWRWRLKALTTHLGLTAPRLDVAIEVLQNRVAALDDRLRARA